MASADLSMEPECSICLNIYTDPVTLKCGHSFCLECIDQTLDSQEGSGHYSCPKCQEEFQERPALHKRIRLHNEVENLPSAQPDQTYAGIPCTYCVDSPVAAVKSCLLCEVSLCEKHLTVHTTSPEHVLTDPTTEPKSRKCPRHKEVLKYYCTQDAASICVSCCLIGGHKGHDILSLEEASEEKKKKLREVLQEMKTKSEKTEERVQSLQKQQERVRDTSSRETERVTTLFKELKRQLDDLEKIVLRDISLQAERLSSPLTEKIQQLELEMEELSRKMGDMEETCKLTDPLTVLQRPHTGDLCDPEEGGGEGPDLDVVGVSQAVHAGVNDIIEWMKVYIAEPAEISLDVRTANSDLIISEDLKSASATSKRQNRPETPERFMDCPQVLSRESFSSGLHYWEVEGEGRWRVGMSYPSIERIGLQSVIGYNEKSWSLGRGDDHYGLIHDWKEIQLSPQPSSNRFRIFLDYEAGRISFYELSDQIRHLHTFTTTFTEPLHVGLLTWGHIRITTVSRESDASLVTSHTGLPQ